MKKYKLYQHIAECGYAIKPRVSTALCLSGLLATLLLSGCSFMPETPEEESYAIQGRADQAPLTAPAASYQPSVTHASVKPFKPQRSPRVIPKAKPNVAQANRLMQQGQRAKAADMYYRAAFDYQSPQRERVILQAAEISASIGAEEKTRDYLSKAASYQLTPANQIRYRYILSLLALHNRQASKALALLPRNSSQLPAGLRDKIAMVRQRAINMGAQSASNSRTTPLKPSIRRKIAIKRPTVQYQSGYKSSDNTAVSKPQRLRNRTTAPANNQPELITSTVPTTTQTTEQTTEQITTQPSVVLPTAPNKVAVLLPSSGALSQVGDEIYQGIEAAQATSANKLLSKRYPVNKSTVISQYQQAVADGADIVVGPLDKDTLATLTAQPQLLSIPLLSLNYLPDSATLPHRLYQFGLSPEDEARQIAEFALSRQQENAVIMAPDSTWGKRLANSFAQTYQQRGGNIMGVTFYANSAPSTYLKRVRKLLAQAKDADMVFLAAAPTQARLIRPLLKDQAGILPVYATSHIFSGRLASNKDIDLDGIVYTEIPYILKKTSGESLDELKFPRLYALGMDSVLIAKNLAPLLKQQALTGQTGHIRMDSQRRMQRNLEFATFINGQPHSLGQ